MGDRVSVDLAAIHEAQAAQIAENVARDLSVYAFDPGESRRYPCVVVDAADPWVSYHESFGDNALAELQLGVTVMVSGRYGDSLRALADYCSDGSGNNSSIRAAIETDRTWGGTVASCCVYRSHPPVVVADNADALAVTFDVTAILQRGV